MKHPDQATEEAREWICADRVFCLRFVRRLTPRMKGRSTNIGFVDRKAKRFVKSSGLLGGVRRGLATSRQIPNRN